MLRPSRSPLALATAALVSLAALHAAPAHPAGHSAPTVVVRAQVLSGTPQAVWAHVSASEPVYEANFPELLTVRIAGGTPVTGKVRRVKFECISPKDCALWAPDRPDKGDRKGPSDYEVDVVNGRAALHVSITAKQPAGTYTVVAVPLAETGERAVPSSPFVLTSR